MIKQKSKITYAQVGDNYSTKDPVKVLIQSAAKQTSGNLTHHGFTEVKNIRGESAYVWKQGNIYMASVIEGLGTKNLIADAMYRLTGKTYYDVIAHDTVATIINDLISVGATPLVLHAYWAIEDNTWLQDMKRMKDFINGWKKACDVAGVSWGGGETATMKQVLIPNVTELAGCAIGIITSPKKLISDKNIQVGDCIIFIKSSGVNANGISLTRAVAKRLPEGYLTRMNDKKTYGEGLLAKSNIYAKLIQDIQSKNIFIHYLSNITGHGLRKVMRARTQATYRIREIFKPQEVFSFIQRHANLTNYDMYDTYNMGMDYAIFVAAKNAAAVQEIISHNGFTSIIAGFVEKGPRQVIIEPLNITFTSETLQVR